MTISTSIIKSTMAAAVGILGISAANAVVAKPGVNETLQPDGSVVSIRLEGSYGNHRAYSSDGYLLTTDEDGFYVFADCGADGLPVSSGIRAANPEMRSAEVKAAVAGLDQARISDAFIRRNDVSGQKKATMRKGPGLFSTHFPSVGEQRAIVVLVNFSNKEFSMEDPNEFYNRHLNEEGFSDYGGTGSARDFFVDNSYGQFLPTFDVYGPVTLSHPVSYYGANDSWGNDKRPHEMVIEACQLLDDEVDFSEYDRNGDGVIDNVYVYYAGYGEADNGGANTIWPHSYDIMYADPTTEYFLDGVQLNHYACSNELDFYSKEPTGIGTITHEFSHVMGLPDLYATDNSGAFTPGAWNILDVGSYNNNSCTPPNYSSFERYALGWMEPEELTEYGDYTLEALPESNKAYIIRTEKENEYFLIENRQQTGNDKYIPGHGMLVWHIDFVQQVWDYNTVNNSTKHQHVDLVEADNKRTEKSRSGDSFPGTDEVTSFGGETQPALLSWDEVSPGIDLIDIAESEDGIISFTVKETTGVDEILAVGGSHIVVEGRLVSCGNGTATVYDLSGKTVATVASAPVMLAPGLYIIASGKERVKVVLK